METAVLSGIAIAIELLFDDVDEQDSDGEDVFSEMMELGALLRARDEQKTRIRGYVEQVVPMYPNDDFRRHFRVTRSTFDVLLAKLCVWEEVPSNISHGGRRPISPDKHLLITLWYLGCEETFRQIADRFGISESSAHSVVRRVCTGLMLHLRQIAIKWPLGARVDEVRRGFEALKGFPNVLGAVDGSHIPIKPPSDDRESYINRKKFPSLLLQAVCDHQMFFVDCYCGWPGSVHDARVLRNSDLFNRIMAHPADVLPGETHILGDAAYPLKTWLLTPYRDTGHLRPEEKKYNYHHSATRMVIERAFALLKGRWRRLKYLDLNIIKHMSLVIMAACILHNICLCHEEDITDFLDDAADLEVNDFEAVGGADVRAAGKREQIKNYINDHY